ncbi:hypothetical protein B0T24DRAFT_25706 [Lasiosphaeria ovina]|uniref:Meiotically up-regulated protein Msb1/Mug8 domain-containing protein n=1 Tax=Lasiosphaeria ovina TaxID=92902 RepID=A0AAE0NJT2_9PEZI|nr:hypothetical protein B0T24DRAFT_25706 [Lasiosphaeria ovina]
MPSLFSRFKGKDSSSKKSKKNGRLDQLADLPPKPRWEDAWTRKTVDPEEIEELVKLCTEELKARALDLPFLLLPFRPTSDPSAVRTFVRHFFDGKDGYQLLRGEALAQELRMTEPMVISGAIKWCWSRLQGGVVGWDSYELFKVGEQDSNMARDSFKTFIPLSVDNESRKEIIFAFFDLLAAIGAHGKTNGFGGRKLSRMAAWWAFEQKDNGNGFEGGYKAWLSAADATSHLFFAYLRSLAPQHQTRGGISLLPMSLQKLLQETEYPPERPALMQSSTNRVSMIVDTVSPTPFALLRRAKNFQYHDEDRALREWSEYEDPLKALTEECRRVLRAVSAANQSQAVSSSKHSTSLRDASWSRFEDIGFTSALEEEDEEDNSQVSSARRQGLRTTAASGTTNLGRPTTPSWADFLSSGFVDDRTTSASNHLLPPDKVLPPIETTVRQRSSQSHKPRLESDNYLEPGELASIVRFDLDDAFWWVWMSSLAPEETPERKATFGRCAVVETVIRTGRFLVMEEIVKGAAPDPQEGAYIAEKKGFFSWTRRGKISRRKSTGKNALDRGEHNLKSSSTMGFSKTSIGPDQQAKIQAAALHLQMLEKQKNQQQVQQRRGRDDSELMSEKTNSVLTLQSAAFLSEASPAVKWANKYDKDAIREAYLSNAQAGRGGVAAPAHTNGNATPTTNGYDRPPELPPKSPSPLSQSSAVVAPAPPAPIQRIETPEPEPPKLIEKALEAPKDVHPIERVSDASHITPVPPPKEPESIELARETMISPEPDLSPDSKRQRKLHKDMGKGGVAASASAGGGGAFRKLFGRSKNRQSKLPENAAQQLQSVASAEVKAHPAPAPAAQPRAAERPAVPEKTVAQQEARFAAPVEDPFVPEPVLSVEAAPAPELEMEPIYEPSVHEDVSRVNTADAAAAEEAFSQFNQGPLLDQPAFVPDADSDDDDAVPPPIARHVSRSPIQPPQPEEDTAEQAPEPRKVDPQNRWAQIRKNAAELAAQRQPGQAEERAPGGLIKTADGDDDTSGEETIESRVARIKARVAVLTGNTEGFNGPGSPSPVVRR